MLSRVWQQRLSQLREQPSETAFRGVVVAARLAARAVARRRLGRAVPLDFLAARPQGALGAEYCDLWFLYSLVRQLKPTTVLEFGSGCSTVVMGYALRDNEIEGSKAGRIYSVEADPRWADVTRSTIPSVLTDIVDVSVSRLTVTEIQGSRVYLHVDRPAVVPDLLYLDGPELPNDVRGAADVLEMEQALRPGFRMVVDGRTENVAFLQRSLKRRYRVFERQLSFNTVFTLLE